MEEPEDSSATGRARPDPAAAWPAPEVSTRAEQPSRPPWRRRADPHAVAVRAIQAPKATSVVQEHQPAQSVLRKRSIVSQPAAAKRLKGCPALLIKGDAPDGQAGQRRRDRSHLDGYGQQGLAVVDPADDTEDRQDQGTTTMAHLRVTMRLKKPANFETCDVEATVIPNVLPWVRIGLSGLNNRHSRRRQDRQALRQRALRTAPMCPSGLREDQLPWRGPRHRTGTTHPVCGRRS